MNKIITIALSLITCLAHAQQYTFKTSAPSTRMAMGCAVIETGAEGDGRSSKIYVFGGSDNGVALNTTEEYNVLTDTWTTKTPMPYACLEGFAATVNNKIYVIGGFDNGGLNKVQEYNPATDSWTLKSPMPTPRSQLSGTVINNKIYVVGGWPIGYTTLEIYDPATDTWTTGADISYDVEQNNGGVTYNNEFYLIGGKTQAWSIYDYNSKYSPATNTWTTLAPLPAARFSGSAVNYNGKIHYFGGTDGQWIPNYNTHYIYNVTTDSWITGLAMPKKLTGQVSAVANNKVYIIGGLDSANHRVATTIEYSETITNVDNINRSDIATIFSNEGIIYVKMNVNASCKLSLYDMSGKEVYIDNIDSNTETINVSYLPKGLYVVRVLSKDGIQTQKIVI